MKTLKIDTGYGEVTLTYSKVAKKWYIFDGTQEALKKIESMAFEMGWVYDPKLKNYLGNFIAENQSKFVVDFDGEKTTNELFEKESQKETTAKLEELKAEIKKVMPIATSTQKKAGYKNGNYVGNPIQWNNIDDRIKKFLTREEYMVGFAFKLIGNNGHRGSIIANASDIDII